MAAWIYKFTICAEEWQQFTLPLLGVHWHLGKWSDECLTTMKVSVTEVSIDLSAAKDSDKWPHSKSSPGRRAK